MAFVGTRRALLQAGYAIPPIGFKFNFSAYPIQIRQSGNKFVPIISVGSFIPSSLATATQYYVNISTGSDGNNGLSPGAAFKSIVKSVTATTTLGAPSRVAIFGGLYERAFSFNGTAGLSLTQPMYFEAVGGRVVTGMFDSLSWALDVTFTNCYVATRTSVTRVFDPTITDQYGDYSELTKVADAATCNSTPNSWAQSGSLLYVHRLDGSAVTNNNTRAYLATGGFNTGTNFVYVSGVDFEGGGSGAVAALSTSTRNIIFDNCSAKYSGGPANIFSGFTVQNLTGLSLFNNCTANANTQDGFNAHWLLGGAAGTSIITIGCTGLNNGRFTSTSNNGVTWHEGITGIDVNGVYDANYGGNVAIIDDTQGWFVGTEASSSFGDMPMGGSLPPLNFQTGNAATAWLQGTSASKATNAFYATGSSSIRLKSPSLISGSYFTSGTATITTW